MSERSFRRWGGLRRTIGALLRRFDLVLAQSEADAARYQSLGAPRVVAAGSLKFDVPPPPADRSALAALDAIVASRPLLVAASTHPGEEAIVAAAHRELAARLPKLLTILAPRHPERGAAVAAEIAAGGLAVARRALGERIEPGTAIYVADTMGELGLLYRLGGIVFIGGTLIDKGGQNPIEPAKLGRAVLHGPYVGNFIEAYGALDLAGGAILVADAASLAAAAGRLLAAPEERRRVAAAASEAVAGLAGALDRTLAALEPYLVQIALERS
jgi:3-deoxy-D-manno-octulosonic-acid transferase